MNAEELAEAMHVWGFDNRTLQSGKRSFPLEMIDQIASLFSPGDFYYYVLDLDCLKFDLVHGGTREVLGIEPDQFTLDGRLALMHPDDIPHLYEKEALATDFLYHRIEREDILSYKIVYLLRLRHAEGHYKTILHQEKALSVTDGKIHYLLGIHTDVTHLNISFNHNVSFRGYQKPSYYATYNNGMFTLGKSIYKSLFTKREVEIIQQISHGLTFNEMADRMHVSPHTVNTHKKNILLKSGCHNMSEVIARCIREGII